MEPSKHKIIRCSENEVEREVLHSSVNKYTPYKNSTQQGRNRNILGGLDYCFQHFATFMFIEYWTGAHQEQSHFQKAWISA